MTSLLLFIADLVLGDSRLEEVVNERYMFPPQPLPTSTDNTFHHVTQVLPVLLELHVSLATHSRDCPLLDTSLSERGREREGEGEGEGEGERERERVRERVRERERG